MSPPRRERNGGREDRKAVRLYLVSPTPRHDMMVTGPVLNRSFAGNTSACPKFESAQAMPCLEDSVLCHHSPALRRKRCFCCFYHDVPWALETLTWMLLSGLSTRSRSLTTKTNRVSEATADHCEPSLTKAERFCPNGQKQSCSEGNLMDTLCPARKTIVSALLRLRNATATGFKNLIKKSLFVCVW